MKFYSIWSGPIYEIVEVNYGDYRVSVVECN